MTRGLLGAAVGLAAVTTAAVGGAAYQVVAERRRIGDGPLADDPEWRELHRPLGGTVHRVRSSDGTELHAEVTGPADAPTLLLCHGYALSMAAWHHQRRDLAGRFRVVAYDQRGHGASAPAALGDYSAAALGRDVAAVLDALGGPGRVVGVGHSMGGMGLLAYADQHPDALARRFAGLVLVDTTGGVVLPSAVRTTGWAALSALTSGVWGGGLRVLGQPLRSLGNRPDTGDAVPVDPVWLLTRTVGLSPTATAAQVAFTEELLAATPNAVVAALGPVLVRFDLRRAAPSVRVPALVVVGRHDRVTPPSAARALAEALPDAELLELRDAGHMAPLEAHEAVTAHVHRFAAGVLAAAPPGQVGS